MCALLEEEKTWLPGYIGCWIQSRLKYVKLTDGQIVRCHQDQIRQRTDESVIPVESADSGVFISSGATLPTTVLDSRTGTGRTASNSSPSKRANLVNNRTDTPQETTSHLSDLYQM